ncbi:MAG: hypothetical protein EX270_08935 [Pseudomonadales bacterium]|nr:MAG: hypothetical protein EX270_08935 [Pseudomonadales bacterium]
MQRHYFWSFIFTNLTVMAIGLVLIFWSQYARAQTVDIEFQYTTPTTRADGSALPASQISGYELSVQGGGLIAEIAPGVTEYVASGFSLNNQGACFELVTVDTQGNKSAPAVACLAAVPGKPQTFTVRVRAE